MRCFSRLRGGFPPARRQTQTPQASCPVPPAELCPVSSLGWFMGSAPELLEGWGLRWTLLARGLVQHPLPSALTQLRDHTCGVQPALGPRLSLLVACMLFLLPAWLSLSLHAPDTALTGEFTSPASELSLVSSHGPFHAHQRGTGLGPAACH